MPDVAADTYVPRRANALPGRLVLSVPAVFVTGPRATGKTTSAGRLAAATLRLDQPRQREVVAADPDAAIVSARHPLLIDEWQLAPDVLEAVKRAVDSEHGLGRFLVTGSTGAHLTTPTWPGTGRLIHVPLFGMTTAERLRSIDAPTFVDRLVAAGGDVLPAPGEDLDLGGYVEEVLVGGFPEAAVGSAATERRRWLESYVEHVISRDIPGLGETRDPFRLRQYLETLAANAAGVVDERTLLAAAGVGRATAAAYERLLASLVLVDHLPAWWSNRLKRLVQRPKRHLIDAALTAALLGADATTVMRDGDVLGRLLDTFVTSQLRAEAPYAEHRYRLFHLRTQQGRHELDLVVELPGALVIGIEVKATAAPKANDARHLIWLRDALGDDFVCGAVLHAAPSPGAG